MGDCKNTPHSKVRSPTMRPRELQQCKCQHLVRSDGRIESTRLELQVTLTMKRALLLTLARTTHVQ
eukprot:2130724-Amphidinium_carterae.1